MTFGTPSTLGQSSWCAAMRLGRVTGCRGPAAPETSDAFHLATCDMRWQVHLAASLLQFVEPATPIAGLHSQPTDRLIYYAAHDINIYLLRRLLRLSWLTESFNPNESPPGGFLSFELYSHGGEPETASPHSAAAAAATTTASGVDGSPLADSPGDNRPVMGGRTGHGANVPPHPTPRSEASKYYVKVFFNSQSYEQQRQARPLSSSEPAGRAFAMIGACASGPELSCPFDQFKALVLGVVVPQCVQLVDPSVLRR